MHDTSCRPCVVLTPEDEATRSKFVALPAAGRDHSKYHHSGIQFRANYFWRALVWKSITFTPPRRCTNLIYSAPGGADNGRITTVRRRNGRSPRISITASLYLAIRPGATNRPPETSPSIRTPLVKFQLRDGPRNRGARSFGQLHPPTPHKSRVQAIAVRRRTFFLCAVSTRSGNCTFN